MSKSTRKAVYKEVGGLKEVHTRRVRRVQKGFIKAHQLDLIDDDFDTPIPLQDELVDKDELCDYRVNYDDDRSSFFTNNISITQSLSRK